MPKLGAQILGEALRAFELRGSLRRSEILDAAPSERIAKPGDQRRFGTDDDEADGVPSGRRR